MEILKRLINDFCSYIQEMSSFDFGGWVMMAAFVIPMLLLVAFFIWMVVPWAFLIFIPVLILLYIRLVLPYHQDQRK